MDPSTPPPGGLDSPEFLDRVRTAVAPRYEVVRMVGWGGMAAVFLARETRLGRQVALKVMAPQLMADRGMVERFAHEARTTAQLTSPWVVTVFDVDEREGLHFFTMRYVGGRTLAQVMDWNAAPLPIPVIRTWMAQVGGALAHAHRRGVIHRDVKPSNVLLDVDGTALVSDFGIAKLVLGDPNLTQTGLIVGTPTYMSPEQCIGDPTTPASDQYAFGAVAYQMISGQPPFSGPTLTVLNAQVSEVPPPLLGRRPDCPPELAAAVERMLAKRPDQRWPGMDEGLEAGGAVVPPPSDGVWAVMDRLAAPVAGVVVEQAPQTLQVGAEGRIVAFAVDAAGQKLEDRRIDWQSAADAVLGVGPGGTLEARGPGVVTVVGRSAGAEARVTLAVRPPDTVLLPALPVPTAHSAAPTPATPPISAPPPGGTSQIPAAGAAMDLSGGSAGTVAPPAPGLDSAGADTGRPAADAAAAGAGDGATPAGPDARGAMGEPPRAAGEPAASSTSAAPAAAEAPAPGTRSAAAAAEDPGGGIGGAASGTQAAATPAGSTPADAGPSVAGTRGAVPSLETGPPESKRQGGRFLLRRPTFGRRRAGQGGDGEGPGGGPPSGEGSNRSGLLAGGVAALLVFLVGGWLILRPTAEDSGGASARISAAGDPGESDPGGSAPGDPMIPPPTAEDGITAPGGSVPTDPPAEAAPGDRPAGASTSGGGIEAAATPPQTPRPAPPASEPAPDPDPAGPEPTIIEEESPAIGAPDAAPPTPTPSVPEPGASTDPQDTVPAVGEPGPDTTPPAGGAEPPNADIQQITAIARGIMEAVANADEESVRGTAPGFSGTEPWWVFMADSAGDYTRTVRLLPQTQVVPIGNTATVILSLSVDLADDEGEVVESRTWPLTMRFLRSDGVWSLDDLR